MKKLCNFASSMEEKEMGKEKEKVEIFLIKDLKE